MDRETILRRAAKLAALAADGSSMAEAESAADALAKLLAEHRLTMTDVDAAAMKAGVRNEERHTAWVRIPRWAEALASAITKATDCVGIKTVRWTPTGPVAVCSFIGESADAAVAGYWFEVLTATLPRMAEKNRSAVEARHRAEVLVYSRFGRPYKRRTWKHLREAFLYGAAVHLGDRLAAKLRPPAGPEGDAGRALMVVKGHAVKAWMDENMPKVGAPRTCEIDPDQSAAHAGMRAAADIPLADGIAHRSNTLAITAGQ